VRETGKGLARAHVRAAATRTGDIGSGGRRGKNQERGNGGIGEGARRDRRGHARKMPRSRASVIGIETGTETETRENEAVIEIATRKTKMRTEIETETREIAGGIETETETRRAQARKRGRTRKKEKTIGTSTEKIERCCDHQGNFHQCESEEGAGENDFRRLGLVIIMTRNKRFYYKYNRSM
jgi:hypothetical protein